LDDRCTITITDFDKNTATLVLHERSGNEIGSIKIQQNSEALVIKISSNTSCDARINICEKTLRGELKNPADPLNCTLQFNGTKTPKERNTLTCNDQEFDLDSDREVFSLKDAVRNVRQLAAEGVGSYQLTCPG
jgi:hypothetical protein